MPLHPKCYTLHPLAFKSTRYPMLPVNQREMCARRARRLRVYDISDGDDDQ